MSHQVEWAEWLQRWDDQQAGYLPDREQQFSLMLEIVERLVGTPHLARQTTASGRVRFAEADLRAAGWDAVLGEEQVDAVCSTTALHWLDPTDPDAVAQTLARRIRPGAVFLNADTMRLGPDEVPRLDALAVALRDEIWADSHAAGVEDWKTWWDAAAAEPAFAELLAERETRFANRWKGRDITLTDTIQSFRKAGFTEVAVLGQVADKHLFAAIR